jgi:hypothetical protein
VCLYSRCVHFTASSGDSPSGGSFFTCDFSVLSLGSTTYWLAGAFAWCFPMGPISDLRCPSRLSPELVSGSIVGVPVAEVAPRSSTPETQWAVKP